jgi:hypothetical protein
MLTHNPCVAQVAVGIYLIGLSLYSSALGPSDEICYKGDAAQHCAHPKDRKTQTRNAREGGEAGPLSSRAGAGFAVCLLSWRR